jgi:hypothetical protein
MANKPWKEAIHKESRSTRLLLGLKLDPESCRSVKYAERLSDTRWDDTNCGEISDTKPGLGNQRKGTEIASVFVAWLRVWLNISVPDFSGADVG